MSTYKLLIKDKIIIQKANILVYVSTHLGFCKEKSFLSYLCFSFYISRRDSNLNLLATIELNSSKWSDIEIFT